jgi:uncharacterized membrane protein (Fun14 family)
MKVLNIIFIVFFLLSAALQYNDPDPYLWMPIYLYGAFLCYKALRKEYKPLLFIIGIVIYSSYAIYLLLDKNGVISWANEHDAENIALSMKVTKPWIESTREFFGLIILIAALAINMVWLSRRRRLNVF